MSDTDPARALEKAVQNFCSKALGAAVSSIEARFQTCTLTLGDGRRVVAKITAFKNAANVAHLSAAYKIQEGLRRMGMPCPRLLAGPEPLNDSQMIVVHEHYAPGVPHSCETPQHLAAVAAGLHKLKQKSEGAPYQGLRVLASWDVSPMMPGRLRAAAERWDTLQATNDWAIMHGDFKARNLRFEGTNICAIYDFESLRIASESFIAGYSSVAFSGGHERLEINFDLHTARAFVAAYEAARGKRFTEDQRRAAHAGMIYCMIRMGRLLVAGGALTAEDLADRVLAFEDEIRRRPA